MGNDEELWSNFTEAEVNMKLSRFWKIAIGLATLFAIATPFLFIPLAFLPFFLITSSSINEADPNVFPPELAIGFAVFFLLMLIYAFVQLALQVFYLIHVIQNDRASKVLRILCGVGAFFMPYLAMPVYYFTYLWPESPPTWALEPRAPAPARKAKP